MDLYHVEGSKELAQELTVSRSAVVVLRVEGLGGFESIDFQCRLRSKLKGHPDCVQGVDMMGWDDARSTLKMGTDDIVDLVSRYPWLEVDPYAQPCIDPLVHLLPDGLRVSLRGIPVGKRVDLYFVVAEGPSLEDDYVYCAAVTMGPEFIERVFDLDGSGPT